MRALAAVVVGLGLLTVGLPAAGTEPVGRMVLPHEFLGLPAMSQVRHFEDPLEEFASAVLGPSAHLAGDLEVLAVGSQSLGRYDQGTDLVRDAAGNLVMVGNTYTGSRTNPYDLVVAKFLATGQAAWVKRFNGGPYEFAYGAAVDDEGNIVVGGYRLLRTSGWSSTYLPFVAKFSGDGTFQWSKTITLPSLRYLYAVGVATDGEGNVLLGGYGYGRDWRTVPLAAKLSPGGALEFVKTYPSNASEVFLDVAADSAGNLVLAGGRYDEGYDMMVRKLSPSGADLGSVAIHAGSYEYATSVVLEASGAIVVAGPAGNGDTAVARVKPDLTVDWVRTLDLPGYATNLDVAVDNLGAVTLGGSLYTAQCCGSDFVVAKLLAGGMPLFVRSMDLSDYDSGAGIAVTPYGGEIILGGTSRDVYESDSGYDLVVVRSLGASGAGTVLPTVGNLPAPDLHQTPVPLPPLP